MSEFKFGEWYPESAWTQRNDYGPHMIISDGKHVAPGYWGELHIGGQWATEPEWLQSQDGWGDVTHFMVLPPPPGETE